MGSQNIPERLQLGQTPVHVLNASGKHRMNLPAGGTRSAVPERDEDMDVSQRQSGALSLLDESDSL
jgi:hypothetical protein